MKLACANCSDPEVMAFSPGRDAYEVAGIVIERPAPPRAWCESCWRRWHCSPRQAVLFTELPSVTAGDRQSKGPRRSIKGLCANRGNGGAPQPGSAPGGATDAAPVTLGNTARSIGYQSAPILRAKKLISLMKARCPVPWFGVA